MVAYDRTGYMYEKYNAFEVGVGGGGGEYVPQIGFGWSNAVALMLLNDMYPASVDDDSAGGGSNDALAGWAVALIVVLVILFVSGLVYFFHCSARGGGSGVNRESDLTAAIAIPVTVVNVDQRHVTTIPVDIVTPDQGTRNVMH